MFKRLKTALVESYIATFALGSLLAAGLLRATDVVVVPLQRWIMKALYPQFTDNKWSIKPYLWAEAAQYAAAAAIILVVVYVLLRWLYYPPRPNKTGAPLDAPDPSQTTSR
jgi:hypothetical protein